MEHVEKIERLGQLEQLEQLGSKGLQLSAGEIQNTDVSLSGSAPKDMPTSELDDQNDQNLPVQTLEETSDPNNQSQRAVNLEMHLLPEKASGGEDATPVTAVPSRLTISHSNGDTITAPDQEVDCRYYNASFHAGQMDTTLPRYEPNQHTSPLMNHSELVQLPAQQDELDAEVPRIQAYAKLEFEDGEFYMNTYSVELGRDLEAARLAFEWEQENSQFAQWKRRRTSTSSAEASPTKSAITVREDQHHNGRTVISDTGGIMGPDAQESHIHKKPRLSKSNSATPSSPQPSRNGSIDLQNAPRAGQSPVMASLIDASALHQADPEACPLIRIHPPNTGQPAPASHRGISRRHAKIAFNFEKHVFELTIFGRNGAFVDEIYYKAGDTIALKNANLIQIGGVGVRFLLPDMSSGEESGAAADPFSNSAVDTVVNLGFCDVRRLERKLNKHGLRLEGSPYESSFVYTSSEENEMGGDQEEAEEAEGTEVERVEVEDDENGTHIGSSQAENSSEPEELEAKPSPKSRRVKQNGKIKTKVKQAKKSGAKPSTKTKPQPEALANSEMVPGPTAPIVKRKGPGRPPKNGIMSKREQKLLAKQAQEAAKATEPSPSGEKVMDANQDDTLAPPVPKKRKYTKRKIKDAHPQPGQNPGDENPEHTRPLSPRQASEAQPKAPKEKKSARPPRSPSPVVDRATLSKEQLLRPNASYLHILHDVLSQAPPEGMGLPQIYNAITKKYLFFKYEVTTVGWQSSVRHNLSQHDMFRRMKREGKGWLWALNPDVPLEKEKKRRVASPSRPAQHPPHLPQMMGTSENYQQPHMMHGPHNFPQPYPMHASQDYPHPSMIPHPYHYPGVSIPNGQSAHNNVFTQFKPPDEIPNTQPDSSHPGTMMGSTNQGVGPKVLPLSLLKSVADSSSTYQSPYQSIPPIRPSEPSVQRPASAATLVNGLDGARDPGTVEPPPPPLPPPPPQRTASETPTAQLNCPSPSPAAHTQPLGPASAPATNTSPEITQAIEQFKTNLVSSMKDHQHGEALVSSAINRVLGNQASSSLPGNEEDPQEKTIMQIFSGMLDNLKKKSSKLQQPQPSQPPPSESPISQAQSGHFAIPAIASFSSSPTLQ